MKAKLVRDRILEIIEAKGSKYKSHIADDVEYKRRLAEKLLEEVEEFHTDGTVSELADIIEVVYAICESKKIAITDLETVRKQKLRRNGGFKKKIILDEWS